MCFAGNTLTTFVLPRGAKEMALSVHDNLLVSYEVQCDARTILLRTEHRVKNEPTEFVNVMFKGVEGYRFENDAFGNIVFDIETVALDQVLKEHNQEISESYRMAGAIRAFILSSSHGLSGWVLAREISISPVQ